VALKGAAFTLSHIFDLLGDMCDVGLIELAGTEEGRVALSPLEKVEVV